MATTVRSFESLCLRRTADRPSWKVAEEKLTSSTSGLIQVKTALDSNTSGKGFSCVHPVLRWAYAANTSRDG